MPCVCFPLFAFQGPSLKGQLRPNLDTSIPLYSDLLEPDAPCPARGGHRVAAFFRFFLQPFSGSREANSRLSVRGPRCTLDISLRTLTIASHWHSVSVDVWLLTRTPSRTACGVHVWFCFPLGARARTPLDSTIAVRDGVSRPAETECRPTIVRILPAESGTHT